MNNKKQKRSLKEINKQKISKINTKIKNKLKTVSYKILLSYMILLMIFNFGSFTFISIASEDTSNPNGSKIKYEFKVTIPGEDSNDGSGSDVENGGLRCADSDLNVPLFLQGNYQDIIPSFGGSIAALGCGLTSVAMCVSAITGKTVTPDVANKKIPVVSLANNGSIWGVKSRQLPGGPIGPALDELKKGNLVILGVGSPSPFTTSVHFVVMKCVDSDGKVTINDPASEANSKKKWDSAELERYSRLRPGEQYYVYETK